MIWKISGTTFAANGGYAKILYLGLENKKMNRIIVFLLSVRGEVLEDNITKCFSMLDGSA